MAEPSRAEMLRKAKEAMAGQKPEGNEYKITGKSGEEIVCAQDDLPELPILNLAGNEDCNISLNGDVTVVKLLIEGCKRCKVSIPRTAKITTSVVEIWRCEDVVFETAIGIGTLQLDISPSLTVTFSEVSQLGQVVQAGVDELKMQFIDRPELNFLTGSAEIRKSLCPELAADDRTTQFITRMVDGELLTEEIIRLANDFPTTAREKAKHDRDIQAKNEALQAMADNLLAGAKGALPEAAQKGLQEKMQAANVAQESELGAEATVEARAEYRRKLGTEQFKIGEWQQAAVHYTESIEIRNDVAAVWCNRAMCWLKLAQAGKALSDADQCIALDPEYTKAHFRRGVALYELKRYREACEAYGKVLAKDPRNDQASASLRLAERKLAMEAQQ